ncbi:putative mannitol dehydrogenase [Acorus gramineus]|uniref:Mannitol dehydrogenase n=1 Tax=Acorus gramineus TaxID=55184 RepID=A0AAV9BG45_ACOGR|nr:putative mannitol dehydrogenase [Acorus gramineus]
MRAVVIKSYGGPEVLEVQEVEDPTIRDDEVLVQVEATALNRADTLQRKGLHPPPKGGSPYPGLECSGTIITVGSKVQRWKIGDQVCALIGGGGYAERVAVPAVQVFPAPSVVSLKESAGFPEVACTVWSTVFMTSRLTAGETFLIHGGSSGIGTFAIQIAKYYGVRVFVTAGSDEKLAACKDLGADVCINYKSEDFVARVKEETGGQGVDVILDTVGGSYFQRNLDSLNFDGRLFIIGFQGGTKAELNIACLFAKRLTVQAAGLRNRSTENKAEIIREVEKHVWPAIEAGKVKPVVCKSFSFSEAVEAHRLMESSTHIGKILLTP